MRRHRHTPISFALAIRLAVAAGCALALLLHGASAGSKTPEDNLFQSTNLLRISLTIPEQGLQILRQGRRTQPKPKAQATVSEGGRTYTNVTVQLKGFTTYQPIDRRAGLTLNFEKLAPKQRFHGLSKISLNNSLQDRTRLHEKFARELFAAAGVPVPRADHAVVTLNGRRLGLYVLTEGYDKEFLKHHFADATGNLYEGGVLQDIDHPLQLNSGHNSAPDPVVKELIRAAREPDPAQRWAALRATLDLDRFISMMAMETILCHSDSYSMNRNNYRLYHDPVSNKLIFMPHGMDRILGTHRSSLDLSILPPALGLVAHAVLSLPEGRRLLVERAGFLVTNLFQPDRLCRRVHEIDAKIAGQRSDRTADVDGTGSGRDADDLCERIGARAADLRLQLAHPAFLLEPAASPRFDPDGVAPVDTWHSRPKKGQPEARCEHSPADPPLVWRLQGVNHSLATSLRTRIELPSGNYLLAGKLEAKNGSAPALHLAASILRHSLARFDEDRTSLDPGAIHFRFGVAEGRWPEELEIICDIADNSPTVQFDARNLRLVRIKE